MSTKHPFESVEASADVMKLTEMILSDCGCSTAISDRLQRRVAGRIQLYVDNATQQLQGQVDALLAALGCIMQMDVKGHALQDRLQFSPAGRAILEQCQAAIAAAQPATVKESLTTEPQARLVNPQLLAALSKISRMTMSMYASAGEAMSEAKRIAHEAIAAAEQEQADDSESEWRRLALQFDGHRMQALAHLRCLLENPEKHAEAVRAFLASPPLSGEQVLAERIAEQAQQITDNTRVAWTSLGTVKAMLPELLASDDVKVRENAQIIDALVKLVGCQQQAEPRCACGDSFTSDAVCANCLAAQPPAVADTTPLTDAQIDRHTITAGECPAASKVMLVSSIRRLLARGDNFMQQPAVAVPDGYALVPIEPTPEMVAAGAEGDSQFYDHASFVYRAMLAAAPQAVATGWIDPNDKAQKQYLPHIGEPVLFCHGGVTYYGVHTGGSFETVNGFAVKFFETWDCLWMYPPAAAQKGGEA